MITQIEVIRLNETNIRVTWWRNNVESGTSYTVTIEQALQRLLKEIKDGD